MTEPLASVSVPMPSTKLTTDARDYLDLIEATPVTTPAEYIDAGKLLAEVKGKWKEIDEMRRNLKRPIDEAARRVQSFFEQPLSFLAEAERIVKARLTAYADEQEIRRRAEQRAADEAAQRQREEFEARAASLKDDPEALDDLVDEAMAAVAPIVPRATPAVPGLSMRTVWEWKCTNFDDVPRAYLMLDEKTIGDVVRALKSKTVIPGIEVSSRQAAASRSK